MSDLSNEDIGPSDSAMDYDPVHPNKCKAKWDGVRCRRKLTANDWSDNIDGYCAECAGILSDNGEW